jgi:hypothetical protein
MAASTGFGRIVAASGSAISCLHYRSASPCPHSLAITAGVTTVTVGAAPGLDQGVD